jgi:hypothetical protein
MGKDGPRCVKVSAIVAEGYEQRIGILLLVTSTTRFYNGVGVHLKKIQGFPHVFYIWKFWKEPFWATWSNGGVVISIVVVPIVVVIVVANLVSKGRGSMQKAKS